MALGADSDREVARLRTALRDLVALSSFPATWIGTKPCTVASGLADALMGLLQLDFAFVRLCDAGGAGAVAVSRGAAWNAFAEWLDQHPATGSPLRVLATIPDVGHGMDVFVVILPVGVHGAGGVVVAGSRRADFATDIERLLLSLAANHAATAFHNARLISERTRAEEQLRAARNELELRVAERTAELQRSEAYLAEAQRLTRTGSFALNVHTRELTHSSSEHSYLYGFDPPHRVQSLDEFFERVHPDDRARTTEALERGIREATDVELEHRVAPPQSPLRYIRAIARPVFTASGEIEEFVGTAIDVTERRRAEEERLAQLWFLESMDRLNRALQRTNDLEQMMGDVLDVVLATFACDRAWLTYPCDSAGPTQRVRAERTRASFVGEADPGLEIGNEPEVASLARVVLGSSGPVRFDPASQHALPSALAERFGIRSMIAVAVHPKVDRPYLFELHQCSHPRVWTSREARLLQVIGRRLADALDTLVMVRNLRESERQLEASRAELAASRVRIVNAADETRRRIERDLHDGVQQRLVALGLHLRSLESAVQHDHELRTQLARAATSLAGALEDLVETSRGIHPAILVEGGLGPALQTLARRSPVPVELHVGADARLPRSVEVAAYYVVSEALTNTAKHARASAARVAVEVRDDVVRLSIADDGSGGADPTRGSGLVGLTDRVDALGGTIHVTSPVGRGTTLLVTLPIADA